jgi:uncharacterized OB-fold protein
MTAHGSQPLPPIPEQDDSTAFFWEGARNSQLLMLRCDACGRHIHPPRPVCRHCLSGALSPAVMSGRGSVYSFTVARQAFHPWFADRLPYVIAVIELIEEPGLRMVSNVVGCEIEAINIGADVEVVFEPIAPNVTLPLFRLRNNQTAAV